MVRLASLLYQGRAVLACQVDGDSGGNSGGNRYRYVDLSSIAHNARAFLELGDAAIERAQKLIAEATDGASSSSARNLLIRASECKLLPPIDGSLVGKFLCIGMNYADHCHEQNAPVPVEPMIFNKFGSSVCGPNDPIILDETVTKKLDYEVELGVVIGSVVPRHVPKDDAYNYVGGFTVVNDVSARDWQLERNGGQWLLGKCGDSYAPLGPVLVTRDELPESEASSLGLRCRVNGATLQDSSTEQLVHGISDLVSFISRFVTLHPGDVIATGTPPGVGCFRDPPLWLKPGDVVEVEIDRIGTLTNPVVAAPVSSGVAKPAPSINLFSRSLGLLHGQSCIVTGAARGIGYGIAARLGMEGAAYVTIVDLDEAAVSDAAARLRSIAPACQFESIVCDVGDAQGVDVAWAKAAGLGGGRIDILVQAAGIVGQTNAKCEDLDPDGFGQVLRVNVNGIFHGCRAALPYMRKQGYGRIVNIASIAGKDGNAGMAAYSTSKAGVIGLTKSIGKEYAEAGITCNALAPAVVWTKMVEDMPLEQVKYMTDKIPMKRCGTIDEIASAVIFMASPQASFTTGFCFDATGGRAVF